MFKHFVSFKKSGLNQCLLKAAEVGVQEMIFIYVFCKTYGFVDRLRLDRLISLSQFFGTYNYRITKLNFKEMRARLITLTSRYRESGSVLK